MKPVEKVVTNALAMYKFRAERRVLGQIVEAEPELQSIIHFSVNKAATQYVKRIVCAMRPDLQHLHLNGLAFWSDQPYLTGMDERSFAAYRHAFRPYGFIYSPFGGFVSGIPGIDDYRKLLVLRDPRDILTSKYFSIAYSHQAPAADKAQNFFARREEARSLGIDEWVIRNASEVAQPYRMYSSALGSAPNVLMANYELLVTEPLTWAERVADFCGAHGAPAEYVAESLSTAQRRSESKYDKRRQVRPGDHERKLRPETIDELNLVLDDVLDVFGYK